MNSAGDPFPDPLQIRRPIICFEFWQIESNDITDEEIGERNDSINSQAFRDWEEEKLKLIVLDFERGLFYGMQAVKIDYKVAYKRNGWGNKPADAGYGYIDVGGTHMESNSVEWLNPDGTKRNKATEDPLFLEFRENPKIDFNEFLR